MKCNQSRPGFELESPCPFPTTITITPRAPPLLLMLSVVAMIPRNYILRKSTCVYKFTISQKKICIWIISRFLTKRKRISGPNKNNKYIQLGFRNGILHWKMFHADNEKMKYRKINRIKRTAKPGKHKNAGWEREYKYFEILEASLIKQSRKKKLQKFISEEQKKFLKPSPAVIISSKDSTSG